MGSGSTGTGVAPACVTASQVAMNVLEGTNDLVAVADSIGDENESQRIEAAADADGVTGLAEGRELLLEGGYLRPED